MVLSKISDKEQPAEFPLWHRAQLGCVVDIYMFERQLLAGVDSRKMKLLS